ncbi:gas vesicle protein GvpO [Streptomyces sp. SP18CS02]|uniref:gas vesicle protein GvpO n=1 Tax=Streptomyces sp. SP18CS02 TaxID=3002531 RepID=UPI002E7A3C54|nr:gas vesicle protein [Streptomyces sp. SP18CS02]MEE1753927.1 gas vesicle protein [Streptomyces sp. SP18CS02]
MANTSENTNDRKNSSQSKEQSEELPGAIQVLRAAQAQLTELTGREAESVSSFEQTEDGWILNIEVLELARVPDTMSLLASYEVQLDPRGELTGYRRVRRYERGRADRSQGS